VKHWQVKRNGFHSGSSPELPIDRKIKIKNKEKRNKMMKNVEIEAIKEMKRDIINEYGYREIEYSFERGTILLKLENDEVHIVFNSNVIDGDEPDESYMLINSYTIPKNGFVVAPINKIINIINSIIYYAVPYPVF
jgi:hypothetical protein